MIDCKPPRSQYIDIYEIPIVIDCKYKANTVREGERERELCKTCKDTFQILAISLLFKIYTNLKSVNNNTARAPEVLLSVGIS